MALETLHFVPGLSRTPLLSIPQRSEIFEIRHLQETIEIRGHSGPGSRFALNVHHADCKSAQDRRKSCTGPSLGENESTNFPGSTFEIFRFAILETFYFCKFLKNMLVRYRGINNKGAPERPGTKWRVSRAISSPFKCQFTGKC